MKKRSALLSVVVLIALALSLGRARAQETLRTFTISPATIPVNLNPGERTEGKLKISNDGDTPLTFNTSVRDFAVKDNIGTPEILPADSLSNKYSSLS